MTSKSVKKIIVKNFKAAKHKIPEDYEIKAWERLKQAVQLILQGKPAPVGLEELYCTCETLCQYRLASNLYGRLYQECENFAQTLPQLLERKISIRHVSDAIDMEFLRTVDICWSEYCKHMQLIRNIFIYMDRAYVLPRPELTSIWDFALNLFKAYPIGNEAVRTALVRNIIVLIQLERKGSTQDRDLIRRLVRIFIDLGIYSEHFEPVFLAATENYYKSISFSKIGELDTVDYLTYVEQALKEEESRAEAYLGTSTRTPMLEAVKRWLWSERLDQIFSASFSTMLDEQDLPNLQRIYRLSRISHVTERLRIFWLEFVKESGRKIVNNVANDSSMISSLINLRQLLNAVLENAFEDNPTFVNSLKEAFEAILNSRQNKPAELLAKYVDSVLRGLTSIGTGEAEINTALDHSLMLFRFIQGKDVFEAFYKKDLARRLLLGRSTSTDAEKSMLSKLKAECGAAFTSRMEGMFRDIDTSHDLMNSFRQSAKHIKRIKDVEFSVSIINFGLWPPATVVKVHIPKAIEKAQKVYTNFYVEQHKGRQLAWNQGLGSCTLKAHFPKGSKELYVSALQAIVLLQFNEAAIESLSYSDIQEATGIDDINLVRTLQSLVFGRALVLIKNPADHEIRNSDTFTYNANFEHKSYKIKINTIQHKETPEEHASTTELIFQDRQYQIDAALVRLMKTHRRLAQAELYDALFSELNFPMNISDVRKRLDTLVEREYIVTDPQNPNTFIYVA